MTYYLRSQLALTLECLDGGETLSTYNVGRACHDVKDFPVLRRSSGDCLNSPRFTEARIPLAH